MVVLWHLAFLFLVSLFSFYFRLDVYVGNVTKSLSNLHLAADEIFSSGLLGFMRCLVAYGDSRAVPFLMYCLRFHF